MILFWTVLVHLIYDFHLQGEFIGRYKKESWFIMAIHCLTWAMVISAVLIIADEFSWYILVFLFLTHYVIDCWKIEHPNEMKYIWTLYIDQALHLITLLVACFIPYISSVVAIVMIILLACNRYSDEDINT